MANAFVEKLRGFAPLSASDEALLEDACRRSRTFPPDHDIIQEGDPTGPVLVILAGWACRYKLLPGGSRQIISFMIPGDFTDIHGSVLSEMDHSIATLTEAKVASIRRDRMTTLIEKRETLSKAFWWAQLVEEAALRAMIVSMGRRTSLECVAHLLCELCFRLRNIGIVTREPFVMPFTQIALADAVGMTPVHVNRLVRKLRTLGALDVGVSALIVSDLQLLARIAGFQDNYLHRRLQRSEAFRRRA